MEPAGIAPVTWVVVGGFFLAFAFGAIANRANFCTMGAVADIVNMGHWGRMRMWLLAIAVAMIGANLLFATGLIDLTQTIYQRPRLNWLSLIVGGALFGVGMSLAGGCANKNLVRVGGGSVRALVVLTFLGISAYMTLRGLFGQWRASYLDPVSVYLPSFGLADQSLASVVALASGLPATTALMVTLTLVAVALLAFIFKDKRFRGNAMQWTAGVVIGLIVTVGWYLTGHIGFGEDPETLEMVYFGTNTRTLESMSFVAPVAFSLEILMFWTDQSLRVTFGIAAGIGVIAGSLAWALWSKSFHWEGFSSVADLRNQIIGGILMGFGGVTALGCTVGQGISGVSTMAIGSFLALAGIFAGSAATLKYIAWRAERDA
jgi:uncharacterized membrane protein YedE/YeeE